MTIGKQAVKNIIGAKTKLKKPEKYSQTDEPTQKSAPTVRHMRVDENSQGQRLDNFLIRHLKGVPKTHLYRVIRSGEVRVNKGRASAETRLVVGDDVRVPPVRLASPAAGVLAVPGREFPVIYEDEHLLVINKPAGVAVHGGSGVSFGVIEQLRRARPQARLLELVHRLDKETSGLLMVAKKRSALISLQDQFRARQTDKTYAVLVKGIWPDRHRLIDLALHKYIDAQGERRVRVVSADHDNGLRSITLVRVVQSWAEFSLLDVTIKTGRTHQIRVHLASCGCPIVGDDKYGDFSLNKEISRGQKVPKCAFSRMFLHAKRLRFKHPATLKDIELLAPLPAECESLIAALQP
jgi:23S rRNA pseudouridine955/2504/2580 synthase